MSNTARTFRLPDELWAAVDEAAVVAGQSKTVFVRRALEEALGGSRVGTPGRGAGDLDAGALPKGPLFGPDAPAPPPRASAAAVPLADHPAAAAKSFRALDPEPAAVNLFPSRGKRAGGFVPRPKKGG